MFCYLIDYHSSAFSVNFLGSKLFNAKPELTSSGISTMNLRLKFDNRPPAWLRWLSNDAARGIVANECHAPIGCHFFQNPDNGEWEVSIFVTSTEIVGGQMDGKRLPLQLQLNIGHVMGLFDTPPKVFWQSDPISQDDELAQHISFEGTAGGHCLWLRVLKESPQGTGPGRLLHAHSGELENLW
jgi:hypothetical protein